MVTSDQSCVTTAPSSWADPTITAPRSSWWRRALPLVAWMTCLVVAVVLLRALGAGRLAAPPLTDPGAWGAWATGRDPLEVVMVVLRVLALGLAWYLTGVTSISVVARLLRAARLARLADALSFGPVKVLVQQAVGIGLAASVLATALPVTPGAVRSGSDAAADADVALLVPTNESAGMTPAIDHVDAAAGAAAERAAVALAVQAPITDTGPEAIVPVPAPGPHAAEQAEAAAVDTDAADMDTDAADMDSDAPVVDSDAPDVEPGPADRSGTATRREVRVEPGDHFWAIAEVDVARHLGRPGTDAEVIAHWQAIVEANADRLPVLGNPDVLFPGQMVLLPSPAEVLT